MKWVLVLIMLNGIQPQAVQGGVYTTMIECFTEREKFMKVSYTSRPAQAVCVRAKATSPL